MNNHIKAEDALLDYLDGRLEGRPLQDLRAQLEASPELRRKLESLRMVHEQLQRQSMESPSAGFAERVMKKLQSPSLQNISPRNGLILVMGIVVAAIILGAMLQGGVFDGTSGNLTLQEVPKSLITLPSVPFNGKVIVDTMVGLSLVLALVVLDRTVLRPFFYKRAGLV